MLFLDISWQTSPGQSFLILEHYLFQWESVDVSVMVVKIVGPTKDEVQAKMTTKFILRYTVPTVVLQKMYL